MTLHVPLGQPNTEFDIVVVVQPKTTGNGVPTSETNADPWEVINAFRHRLAASGRFFTDSAELIREDRDR